VRRICGGTSSPASSLVSVREAECERACTEMETIAPIAPAERSRTYKKETGVGRFVSEGIPKDDQHSAVRVGALQVKVL
jgi:hypothetical protein